MTVGWQIYILGYFFVNFMDSVRDIVLNLVYMIADLVRELAFL